jgi:hypothetical protein
MTTLSPVAVPTHKGGRIRWLAGIWAIAAALFITTNVYAQAPAAPGNAPPPLAAEEIEALVGRIALYPDDLVAIILPASTNPLQLVQADRYLEKRKADPKLPVDEKWDNAVKSLLNYPEVVKSMSADLDWTSALGEAVVADQGAVLEAVQVFRRKTQAAGNLKSDGKQVIVVEKEVIKIVPADPQVIYVPQYSPTQVVVSGYPYGYYPSPYPVYYYPYPPGAAFATGLVWGAAITAAWNGGRYGANYGGGGNTINIDNSTNINRGGGTASQRPAGSGSGSSQWKSNKQPGQVSSSTGRSQSTRVGDTGARGGAGAGGGGARPSTQPSGGAFGGASGSGRQAQMDSSRGAASRGGSGGGGSFSGSGGRQPSTGMSGGGGGGARAGGGGGGARAGGGGGGRGGGGGGGGRGGRR